MFKHLRAALLTGGALVLAPAAAHAQAAQQTTAGTVVTNQATASYTVNGTTQTASSNVATFLVDLKVVFTTTTAQTANTQVNLGQTGAVATFTVTNKTNGTQDFLLDPDQQNLSLGILPGTDNFDMLNMHAYVDKNGNGVYDPGVDTATYIDELAPDQSATVFLVADVPNTPGANLAFVSMHVTAAAGGTAGTQGAALVPTDLAVLNTDNKVDVVFADDDSDGLYAGDIARNGQGRAYAAFEVGVRNVALSVLKTSRVISDGVNTLNPKALPGAVVEYCLTVNNATLTTPATNVTLTDVIPANTTYVPGSISIGAIGAAGICLTGGVPQSDDPNATVAAGTAHGSFTSSSKTVTAVFPTVAGGTSLAASFRVTIN